MTSPVRAAVQSAVQALRYSQAHEVEKKRKKTQDGGAVTS